MRKIFLGFLTFLMFTPVLACAMAFCPVQAAQAADVMPCHEASATDGIMLVLDCMGVDLFQTDVSSDARPDLPVSHVDYAWMDLVVEHTFLPDSINGIRGPPDGGLISNTEPPIILTTQRFRI